MSAKKALKAHTDKRTSKASKSVAGSTLAQTPFREAKKK